MNMQDSILNESRNALLREQWETAVRNSYYLSCEYEEFEAKATPEIIRKVALYMQGTGYLLSMVDDTSNSDEANLIMTLIDFLNFTS